MAKKSMATENKKTMFFQRVKTAISNPTFLFMMGLLMGAVAIFLCSSFLSFFSSGGADQSCIDAAAAAAAAEADAAVQNASGRSGAIVADYLVNGCFGWSSVLLIPLFVCFMLHLMNIYRPRLLKWFLATVFAVVWGSVFFAFALGSPFADSFMSPGGRHGELVVAWLESQIGVVGTVLVLLLSLIAFMTYITRETITWLQKMLTFSFIRTKEDGEVKADEDAVEETDEAEPLDEPQSEVVEFDNVDKDDKEIEYPADDEDFKIDVAADEDEVVEQPASDDDDVAAAFDKMSDKIATEAANNGKDIKMEIESAEGDDDTGGKMLRPLNPKDELSYYKPPTIDLLDKYEQAVHSIDMNEQQANKNKIVEVLRNFDIEISSIKATVGPTITLYEITPAPGVRIGKIKNLEDDIAMSLAALCIRIIAPIPGKGTVGIEVPNTNKQIVPMASLLNSRKYKETDMALPLALGKTISNEVFMVDMAKMPHLLVAGATGMGKSVGLHAIITS